MRNNSKQIKRILAMFLAIIMLVTFFPDLTGMTVVYANEEVTEELEEEESIDVEDEETVDDSLIENSEEEESIDIEKEETVEDIREEELEEEESTDIENEFSGEEDITEEEKSYEEDADTNLKSRPDYDVVHFKIQDVDGNELSELIDDVIEIGYNDTYVKRVIDGFEFKEEDASSVEFTVTVRKPYEGGYKLISVGNKLVAADSDSCTIGGAGKDEQDIVVIVKKCEHEVSAQVNIGGVQYELTDENGRSIENGRKISYGKKFYFKLKNDIGFYNDSVDVIVAGKSGEKRYQVNPDRNNIYTIEGGWICGDLKISQEIAVGYGNVRYIGGFFRGDWEVAINADNVSLVSVREGEEPQKYSTLSVPEGSYKLELKEELATQYKLTEPDKIYNVVKNETTDIDAAIEPNDILNRYNVYVESELKIVNVSTVGNPAYAEMNDNAELAYKCFEAGGDQKKISVYDSSDEISLAISIDETFKEKYEIKSVKYKGTEDVVTKDSEEEFYVLTKKAGSEATEITVVVGTIEHAVTGEFEAKINSLSEKYLEIDSVKASKAEDAEKLVTNKAGKYEIPEGTDYIYIDVKTLDKDKAPVKNIGCRINGAYFQAVATEYDENENIVHMVLDTASLKEKEIAFFVRMNPYIIFDDNVMQAKVKGHSINITHNSDSDYQEAASILDDYGVKGLEDSFYVYHFEDAESLNIGETLTIELCVRDGDSYRGNSNEKDNITFYYQVFGDKPGRKTKITSPKSFEIVLDQINSMIVFTYEVKMIDKVFVDDKEVYDLVVNLDRDSKVKIMSIGMNSNLSQKNSKDPSTATWKISSLKKEKSDELLKVVKDDAVYLNVDDATIEAIGYKQFAIERTENGKKSSWNFIINKEKPVVTVNNLENKTIYAGQEKSFAYKITGSNIALTKDNVKIYRADNSPANEANIKVKEVSANSITIAANAVNEATDKAVYYIDIVNAKGESLLKKEKKLKLNVGVLDSKFSAKNIEYVRSDEDYIYFKVKGIAAEAEKLYTNIVVSANALIAEGEQLNSLYKKESIVDVSFKNNDIIKVPVKVNAADAKDDKSTCQNYSFTFKLQQKTTNATSIYKYAEVKLATHYANRALYYETNLKLKTLAASKNVYTGQKDIAIATPIFSKDSSKTTIIYLKDDKGQIETNDYGEVTGNAYDPVSGNLVINIPATVTPGKHVLTFEAYAPNGYIASKASININVKIGIEEVSMIKSLATFYLGNKDINIKTKTHFYNVTHRPMYESYIKPTTCKATYRVESENEELLRYVTINSSNGNVKVSKNLAKVYDRIKSNGTSFYVIATANDYPGTEIYKNKYDYSDREDRWKIELTTDGASDYLKNNEVRVFMDHIYLNERGQRQIEYDPTDVAIIDKNHKKRTQFTIQQANNLTFRAYRSAADPDDYVLHDSIVWKVSGSVLSYGQDNYGLHIDKVKPGIITVTATAADGSGNVSISRTFEVKKDDYKLKLVDDLYGQGMIPTDKVYVNDAYAFQGVLFRIIPYNDAETEPIIEEPYQDHFEDYEHNYKIKISGGEILQIKSSVLTWLATDQYTTITLINNNKGSDGKKVQEDQVYTIHNIFYDKTESDFDKVKVLPSKTVANTYYEGKPQTKIRFEVTNLPKSVDEIKDGHTGYYLTLAKNRKEKYKFPNTELVDMIDEYPMSSEIMYEKGKYYVELHQNMGKEWWQSASDFVAGTYKLEAYIGKGEISDENVYVLNKKPIETSLTIAPNNLKKCTWEGGKTTKVKIDGNKKDTQVKLVVSANSANADTDYFKWSKNKNVAEVRITDVNYDLDTLNIFKEGLISGNKSLAISSENGNINVTYKAEDFTAIKNAVVNAASGKTVKIGSTAQKAAAKMTAKPDKNGNYDMSKVNPVIRGTFTYEIVGTDATGNEKISNLTQNFEITLVNPKE